MTRTLLISSFICSALAIGCGKDGGNNDTNTTKTSQTQASDSASETGGETGDSTTTTATTKTTEPPTTGDEATSSAGESAADSGFIVTPDGGGGGVVECDVFAQDCEDGQKCTAWNDNGGTAWNATKCVDVKGDKAPGDPCTAEAGGLGGIDDCVKGAMCWDTDEENKGVCIELCTGTLDMPKCTDPKQGCAVVNDGVLNICLDTCEPLVQDCPGDDLCIPTSGTYVCVLDASGEKGAANEPCEFANSCDRGLVCASPASATECDKNATGCCIPMCPIDEPGACKGQGQDCLPIYDMQPIGFENVGFCSLPMG